MFTIFPYGSDRLHRVCVVEEADRDASYFWVFGAAHENRGSTVSAEKLIECAAQIRRARELPRFSLYLNLVVRIIGSFSERRS